MVCYYSGDGYVFPLKNKSAAVPTFKALIQWIEIAESALSAVEGYVSDYGGETIMSKNFQDFPGPKGIFWKTAPRATPNYNGLVERSI